MKRAWIDRLRPGRVHAADQLTVLTSYLRLSSPWIIILLAVGLDDLRSAGGEARRPCKVPAAFAGLAWNMAAEAITKFVGAIVLMAMGFGVLGAVAAISASVIFAFCLPDSARELRGPAVRRRVRAPVGEGRQAIVFFVGQVIISNIDILMVKHFFRPTMPACMPPSRWWDGFCISASWSVVSAMFPVSAENKESSKLQARCWRFRCCWSRACRWCSCCCWQRFPTLVFQSLVRSALP